MEQKIKKWQKQIAHLIDEVLDINERRHVFERERKIVKDNSKIKEDNIFVTYLFRNYAEAQILAISRVVENDGRTGSFVALLNDILTNFEKIIKSGKLSQKLIADINKSDLDEILKEHFKKEQGEREVSWEKINSDKFDLLKATAKLKLFRDKWVAHIDQRRQHFVINYDELNRIVDFLNASIHEYSTLLTNSSMASFITSGIEEDEEIFNFAWSNKDD